jgi:hypothetical protein
MGGLRVKGLFSPIARWIILLHDWCFGNVQHFLARARFNMESSIRTSQANQNWAAWFRVEEYGRQALADFLLARPGWTWLKQEAGDQTIIELFDSQSETIFRPRHLGSGHSFGEAASNAVRAAQQSELA